MRNKRLWATAAFCALPYWVPGHAAVTEDTFTLRSI